MISDMSIQEAAALWGCSERRVQMLCKQGCIPGARKVSGIWLLPADSVHPITGKAETITSLQPERFYGRNTTVCVRPDHTGGSLRDSGCIITEHPILDGITLVFQDIHEEKLDYEGMKPEFSKDLIAIQHCREGRFEGAYANGEYIYMGPGSLSINLPAWAPVSNSFPLRHYHGLYIAILPQLAEPAIQKLEEVLGPLHIDFDSLTERLSGKNKLVIYHAEGSAEKLLTSLYPVRAELREEQIKLRVLELLQMLSRKQVLRPAPEHYFNRDQVQTVKEIRQYLTEHLDRHIPLVSLADRFRISLTGMKACFKGVYGQSMGKYLREYRMQAGAELLISTNQKIIEIAALLGYENASKFSEAFYRYYGLSPTAYRKSFCPDGAFPDRKE